MTISRWKKLAIGGGSSAILLAALVGYFEPSSTPGAPYQDVTGVWTNCGGNTHNVNPKAPLDVSLCGKIDDNNEKDALRSLDAVVTVPLTNNQKAAFADLIYNIGIFNFTHTCKTVEGKRVCVISTIYNNVKAGKVIEACHNLLGYVYADGKKLRGLVARRQAEYTICITPN
jgi:lysozyme